jgi:hypothetical protein
MPYKNALKFIFPLEKYKPMSDEYDLWGEIWFMTAIDKDACQNDPKQIRLVVELF